MERNMDELKVAYRILVSQYLFEKYSLRRLDERFLESSAAFLPKTDAVLREDYELQFISLLNEAHIERLSGAELEMFQEILEDESDHTGIFDFLERTYEKVLAGTVVPGIEFEFFKDIYGRGIFPGNALIFQFRDQEMYDENGKLRRETEEQKARVFERVKVQYEKIANAKSRVPVYLVRR